MRKLKVRGLLENVPECVVADISNMDLNDMMKVADIHIDNITIVDNPSKVIVAVMPTRNSVADAAAEGEEAEAEA